MAGSKGDKYDDVLVDYRIWLKNINNEGILGEGCITLLNDIKLSGSIKEAADKQGISYRRAWGMIKKSEDMLGLKLVDKERGGRNGGRSNLTKEGEKLVAAFYELKIEIDHTIEKLTEKFFNKIKKH